MFGHELYHIMGVAVHVEIVHQISHWMVEV